MEALAGLDLRGGEARLPPGLEPLSLAAARPALVRPWIRLRSSSASAANPVKMNFPMNEVVSRFSVSDRKPKPAWFRSVMRLMR
jgi:hypothetical protein